MGRIYSRENRMALGMAVVTASAVTSLVLAGLRTGEMLSKRVLIIVPLSAVAVLAMLYAVAVYSGFVDDLERMSLLERTLGDGYFYTGVVSLKEKILKADVIAVVEIESVSRGIEKNRFGDPDIGLPYRYGYSKTLDLNFSVTEYLKGTGKDRSL